MNVRVVIAGALLAAAPTVAHADTGTRGTAAALAAHGVTVGTNATALWIGNVAGGIGRGGMLNTLGNLEADADLGRLAGLQGVQAHASVAWIRGRSATWEYVGDALVVSNLDGFDSIRLYEAWLEREWAAGRLGLRAGVLAADGEFGGSEGGALFTNSGFGWSAGIAANVVNGGPIYWSPALGARAAVRPAAGWTLLAGLWDGDSFDSRAGESRINEHGLHFDLDPAQGRFALAELSRAWHADDPGAHGGFRLGAWHHSADFEDQRLDAAGAPIAASGNAPAVHHGNHGAYAVLEQRLWSERADRGQGLSAWGRLAIAPADRSEFWRVGDFGATWTGPLPGRDADVLGLALVNAEVSPAAVLAALDAGAAPAERPDHERVLEAIYRVRFGGRFALTPGVQWVFHPGASAAVPDAVVPELRLAFE